jgi:hypothetical protein
MVVNFYITARGGLTENFQNSRECYPFDIFVTDFFREGYPPVVNTGYIQSRDHNFIFDSQLYQIHKKKFIKLIFPKFISF